MDLTSLGFMVPLLALVASEMAWVSWVTTLPRAESATCNWPVTRFELCVKESSCCIWLSSSTFSPEATGSWLSEVMLTPLDSSAVNCCSLA